MNTLLVSDIFPPKTGGSGRWFYEIYRRLPRRSYLIAAGEHPRRQDLDNLADPRVVRLPLAMRAWGILSFEGVRGYARAIGRLRHLVRDERIEMIHCARCLPEGVMGLALKVWTGVPYACYVHGEDVGTAQDSREHRWLTGARAAQRLIPDRQQPEYRAAPDPGVGTGGGSNPRAPSRSRYRPLRARRAGSFVAGGPGLGASSGGPDRRPAPAPQRARSDDPGVARIREAIPEVLYAIVGDGEERAALADLAEREGVGGHVRLLGEVADDRLVKCYQQCDLFALPNRQVGRDIEGFGMVLLEAQACGKPVIAGASGGTAETMRIPETGLVVDCDEPGPLAAAVAGLLSDPGRRARMGAAARDWVVEHFDWANLSRRAEALFQGRPAIDVSEFATA